MSVPFYTFLCDILCRHWCYFIDPLTCSFLILSFFVTPFIHRSSLISFTSSLFSCLYIVAHVSAPYNNAGLTTVLYISPLALRASFCHTSLHFYQFPNAAFLSSCMSYKRHSIVARLVLCPTNTSSQNNNYVWMALLR